MDKIKVEICCGTACYLLGAANLMSIEDEIPVNFLEVMACPGGCQNGPCSLA